MSLFGTFDPAYTAMVQQWHRELKPDIPIGEFVQYLEPEVLGLESVAEFYAPTELSVHVKGHISEPAGAMRLHVPVHANRDWLAILNQRIGDLYGVAGDRVELRDVTGRPLSMFSAEELPLVGRLSVYIDGRRARLSEMPEVPAEYSINKLDSIDSWYDAVKAEMPQLMANELVKCESVEELIEAIEPNGRIESAIKDHIFEGTTNWNEFVRVNRMNSPYGLTEKGADSVLNLIGDTIRTELDAFIQSAPQQLASYFASLSAERMQRKLSQKDMDAYKPMFSGIPTHVKVSASDGYNMFLDFANSVVDSPAVTEDVRNIIYVKPIEGCRWEFDPDTPNYRDGRSSTRQAALRPPPANVSPAPQQQRPSVSPGAPPAPGAPQKRTLGSLRLNSNLQDEFAKDFDKLTPEKRDSILNVIKFVSELNLNDVNATSHAEALEHLKLATGVSHVQFISNQFMISGLVGKTDDEIMQELIVIGHFYQLDVSHAVDVAEAMNMIALRISQLSALGSASDKFLNRGKLEVPGKWMEVPADPVEEVVAQSKEKGKDVDNLHGIYDDVVGNVQADGALWENFNREDTREALAKLENGRCKVRDFDRDFEKIVNTTPIDLSDERLTERATQFIRSCYTFGRLDPRFSEKVGGWTENFPLMALRMFGYVYVGKKSDAEVFLIFRKLMHNAHYKAWTENEKFELAIDRVTRTYAKSNDAAPPSSSKRRGPDPQAQQQEIVVDHQVSKKVPSAATVVAPGEAEPVIPDKVQPVEVVDLTKDSDAVDGLSEQEIQQTETASIPHFARENLTLKDAAQEASFENKLKNGSKASKAIWEVLSNENLTKEELDKTITSYFDPDVSGAKLARDHVLAYLSYKTGITDWNVYGPNKNGEDLVSTAADTGVMNDATRKLLDDLIHYFFLDESQKVKPVSVRSGPPAAPPPPQPEKAKKGPPKGGKTIIPAKKSAPPGGNLPKETEVYVMVERDKQEARAKELWENAKTTPKKNAKIFLNQVGGGLVKSAGFKKELSAEKFSIPSLKLIAIMYGCDIKKGVKDKNAIITAIISFQNKKGDPVRLDEFNIDSSIEAHNPWNAQIHHLKQVSGSYSDYYIENHMHRDMTEHAPYEGNAAETYDAFHQFTFAHAMPDAVRINGHRCMHSHKKKEKEKKNKDTREEVQMPITRTRPPLVSASVAAKMRERNVMVMREALPMRECPPLIALNIEEKEEEESGHGFSGLPSVDDLF